MASKFAIEWCLNHKSSHGHVLPNSVLPNLDLSQSSIYPAKAICFKNEFIWIFGNIFLAIFMKIDLNIIVLFIYKSAEMPGDARRCQDAMT